MEEKQKALTAVIKWARNGACHSPGDPAHCPRSSRACLPSERPRGSLLGIGGPCPLYPLCALEVKDSSYDL